MFKESKEGQTHSWNDGCGEPAHNQRSAECCEWCRGYLEGSCIKVDCKCHPAVEKEEAGTLKVSNFRCSEHGRINPKPSCPKCSTPSPKKEECTCDHLKFGSCREDYNCNCPVHSSSSPREGWKSRLRDVFFGDDVDFRISMLDGEVGHVTYPKPYQLRAKAIAFIEKEISLAVADKVEEMRREIKNLGEGGYSENWSYNKAKEDILSLPSLIKK